MSAFLCPPTQFKRSTSAKKLTAFNLSSKILIFNLFKKKNNLLYSVIIRLDNEYVIKSLRKAWDN